MRGHILAGIAVQAVSAALFAASSETVTPDADAAGVPRAGAAVVGAAQRAAETALAPPDAGRAAVRPREATHALYRRVIEIRDARAFVRRTAADAPPRAPR